MFIETSNFDTDSLCERRTERGVSTLSTSAQSNAARPMCTRSIFFKIEFKPISGYIIFKITYYNALTSVTPITTVILQFICFVLDQLVILDRQ